MEEAELLESLPFGQKKSVFEILAATFDDLPDEMLAELPADGAENHDHYLYGWPKKEKAEQEKTK